VSKLIGRQVAENDLTLILGIGPKTAEILKSHGVDTWDKLAATPLLDLSKWLLEAGGIYKSQDPTSWAKQATMAAHGEWRKLRLYQETLRSKD
jgi:predicted flap endonuclease-1-like 5' DNA nuclease